MTTTKKPRPKPKVKVYPPEYPHVKVAFMPSIKHFSTDKILGTMGNALRAANFAQDDINLFYDAARRGDRDHLIAICKRWVTITGA